MAYFEWSDMITAIGNMFTNQLLGNIYLEGIFAIGLFVYIMYKLGAGLEVGIIIIAPLILLLSFYGFIPAAIGWLVLIGLGIAFGLFMLRLSGGGY